MLAGAIIIIIIIISIIIIIIVIITIIIITITLLLLLCVTSAIYQKMDTSVGLSTIASLSLGLSMSMAGSGRELICRNFAAAIPTSPRPSDGHRSGGDSKFPCLPQLPRSAGVGGVLQAGFAGPQRRTSFVGILHQMSAQNKLLSSQTDESTDAVRRLSVSDVERVSAADSPSTTTTTTQGVANEDTTDQTRRRTSDGEPCFDVGRADNAASTSRTVTGDYRDVITSRDQCEYRHSP